MPTDGGSRGPGMSTNMKSAPMRKGDGLGANRMDGGHGGGMHAKAGMGHGNARDQMSGSPMKGPSKAGVLKYIRERGSGSKTAPGSGGSAIPTGAAAGQDSPIPTGGEPHKEFNEGNDIPGESREEAAADRCEHCMGTGKKSKYSHSNREMNEPGPKGR